jgi:hypothetical protein
MHPRLQVAYTAATTGKSARDRFTKDAASVDYSLGDEIDMGRLDDWDYTAEMLKKYHPAVGNLITLDHLKLSWRMMDRRLFAREYLGLWGDASGDGGLFSEDQWASLFLTSDLPQPPRRFALGIAASEDNASIVAAWRDEHGEARLLLIDHREGRTWLPTVARDLARRYRVPVVLDPRASQVMADVKQRIEQLRPAPRVELQEYEDVAAAHERMVLEVEQGTVRHFGQQPMTDAFLRVKRMQMGARWKFGRIHEGDDITAAQAATLALRYYDANPRAMRETIAAVAV